MGELTHNWEVVDLLISMSVAAARNKRANGADVFEPFPTSIQVVKRKSPNEGGGEEVFSFYKNGKKLMDELVRNLFE